MSIRSGSILFDAQGFVVQRIQTGGVSALTIPQTKIYEVGNYGSVGLVHDIPDLTFDINSIAVTTDLEAIVHGKAPSTVTSGQKFDFLTTFPIDVISPFRAGNGAFNIVKGIGIPYLTLDTAAYKFGVKANAEQTFTFKGDGIFYIPGSPYFQEFNLVSGTLTYTVAHAPIAYAESGNTLYALSVCAKNPSTGAFKRLFFGTGTGGYTNTSGGAITIIDDLGAQGYTKLDVIYGSTTAATYNASVNTAATVTPAAVRAKDICVYVSDGAATPTLVKWPGVQSVDITYKVNATPDEEFCNHHYVAYDADSVDVNGQIVVRSADAADLWSKIAQIMGVATNVVAGLQTPLPLELEVVINDPITGAALKTFNIPDAVFDPPGPQAKSNSKVDVTFKWSSNSSALEVYKGAKP